MAGTWSKPEKLCAPLRNPFSPKFGGTPQSFFGRDDIIDPFVAGLGQLGSNYRTLFVTGVRGLGKTSLVERLSHLTRDAGWDVIDLPPLDTVDALMGRLAPFDEVTRTREPSVSVSVAGTGLAMGGSGRTSTKHLTNADLSDVFLERSATVTHGLLITIDEIQKVPVDDVARICSAFQMASRKGHNVALVAAGLPYAYERVSAYEGCSYMRRAKHVELQLLTRSEVRDAFGQLLATIDPALATFTDDARATLEQRSKGQPFLMQLLGYELIEHMRDLLIERGEPVIANEGDVELAFESAKASYVEQALEPMLHEAGRGGRRYLETMARAMIDGPLTARSSEIAWMMGRSTSSLASVRARLLRLGIIIAPRRGEVRFNVPYLREYLLEGRAPESAESLLEDWGV